MVGARRSCHGVMFLSLDHRTHGKILPLLKASEKSCVAVLFHLEKVKATDPLMEDLHQLMYRRKGKGTTRKTDIKGFSGFVYAEDVKVRLNVMAIHRKATTTVRF